MTRIIAVLLCLMVSLLSNRAFAEEKPSIPNSLTSPAEMIVGGDTRVQIVDVAQSHNGVSKIVWEWDAKTAKDLPQIYRDHHFLAIDECKPIEGGRRILVTASTGGVAVINRETKAVEFLTNLPMAHSIELLPRGHIAVAASDHPLGNNLCIYSLDAPDAPVLKRDLFAGHGVVFFERTNELYAMGCHEMDLYEVGFDDQNKLTLDLKASWKIPGKGGHDLVYDRENKSLVVTDGHTVWNFKLSEKILKPYQPLRDVGSVKSVSFPPTTGPIAYVKPDEQYWSPRVRFVNSDFELKFPGRKLYKARWIPTAAESQSPSSVE